MVRGCMVYTERAETTAVCRGTSYVTTKQPPEGVPELTSKEKGHLGQEMSDVLLYLVDLANKCHVDLPTAVLAKMEQNAKKYPQDKAFGRADKYTDL